MAAKKIPTHIGIIMDGNRRWAKGRKLHTLKGHEHGYHRAVEIAEHAWNRGIRYLTLYAFSHENWKRSRREVAYLMRLLTRFIDEQSESMHARGVSLRFIGSRSRLPSKVLSAVERAEKLTRDNSRGVLLIALSYGGRQEIIEAVRVILGKRAAPKDVSEKMISDSLYTRTIPDPDLIIRTSGEQRLSGFLLWQAAYSELYFTKTLWPDFTKKEFDKALADYARRKRRFGA